MAGGLVAIALIRTLYPDITPEEAADAVLPHHEAALAASDTANGSLAIDEPRRPDGR